METEECIRTRADVRKYKRDPLHNADVKDIINSAIQAPSSGNVQNWEFIVVRSPDIKGKLSAAAMEQEFIREAPIVVVVCANLDEIEPRYGGRGVSLYSVQNTAAAAQNLVLAAWNKGIASCWVGAFNENDVKKILYLPAAVRPLAIITLGYPAEKVKKPDRKSIDDVTYAEVHQGGKI